MKNPWLKKNPAMSMWLSGANMIMGSVRAQAAAQGKRQATRLLRDGSRQVTDFWTAALTGRAPPRKKASRR